MNTQIKGYELGKLYESLSEEDRHYVLSFFLGGLDCVAFGFTTPHQNKEHAEYALKEFEKSIRARPSFKP